MLTTSSSASSSSSSSSSSLSSSMISSSEKIAAGAAVAATTTAAIATATHNNNTADSHKTQQHQDSSSSPSSTPNIPSVLVPLSTQAGQVMGPRSSSSLSTPDGTEAAAAALTAFSAAIVFKEEPGTVTPTEIGSSSSIERPRSVSAASSTNRPLSSGGEDSSVAGSPPQTSSTYQSSSSSSSIHGGVVGQYQSQLQQQQQQQSINFVKVSPSTSKVFSSGSVGRRTHAIFNEVTRIQGTKNPSTKRHKVKCNHCNMELEGRRETLVTHFQRVCVNMTDESRKRIFASLPAGSSGSSSGSSPMKASPVSAASPAAVAASGSGGGIASSNNNVTILPKPAYHPPHQRHLYAPTQQQPHPQFHQDYNNGSSNGHLPHHHQLSTPASSTPSSAASSYSSLNTRNSSSSSNDNIFSVGSLMARPDNAKFNVITPPSDDPSSLDHPHLNSGNNNPLNNRKRALPFSEASFSVAKIAAVSSSSSSSSSSTSSPASGSSPLLSSNNSSYPKQAANVWGDRLGLLEEFVDVGLVSSKEAEMLRPLIFNKDDRLNIVFLSFERKPSDLQVPQRLARSMLSLVDEVARSLSAITTSATTTAALAPSSSSSSLVSSANSSTVNLPHVMHSSPSTAGVATTTSTTTSSSYYRILPPAVKIYETTSN